MYLETLHIENLRNLFEVDLSLSPGFNYFTGANGAGKTALLEAVHMLARGRSFRTSKTTAVINDAADELLVRVKLRGGAGEQHQLAMTKNRRGETQLRIDGQPERKISETARLLPVQTLLPSAPDLVLGGPAPRRAFLDWGLFHVEPAFLEASRRYRRVLTQRNAWLKAAPEGVSLSQDPWYEQLLALSQTLSSYRDAYIAALDAHFQPALHELAPELAIRLSMDWGGLGGPAEVAKKLGESFPRDVKFGVTHRGPHRADLLFTSGGHIAAETVSRGQAKLIASAIVLAQAEHLYATTRQRSVFLIDDFGAELDAEHWQRFVETLVGMECQVLATSTAPLAQHWFDERSTPAVFHVKQGKVAPAA